jgi:hypothetical protein
VNLEGTLDAFGLPDVFTLLASTGKSGGLLLRRTTAPGTQVNGVVWFREGRISGASSDRSRASLVRRVVGSGAVEDSALRQAVSRSSAGGVGVSRALLEAGAVEPELLLQAATDQTVDAVFDLMRWPDGDFGFDQTATDADDVGVSLEPARVIAEAHARSESWSQLEALIPSPESVLAVPVVLHHDPEVSRDEWALLALVDGRRRVRDLVELTGAGQFAVTTTLAHLVQRGLLHVRDAAQPDHVSVVERRLAMLASVEAPEQATVPVPVTAPEPEPEAIPTSVRPGGPAGPGALRMSAMDALAKAHQVQGGSPTLTGPGQSARPAARREVVPPRPEPFLPGRRPDHPEHVGETARQSVSRPSAAGTSSPSAGGMSGGLSSSAVEGATARALSEPVAAVEPAADGVIERDPGVNRSLLLRLIAGVRGL